MLTSLHVADAGNTAPFGAVELLALLQQALPGFAKPTGEGTLASPWQPKEPPQWWYCAKEKPKVVHDATADKDVRVVQRFPVAGPDARVWLRIGGKLVSIDVNSFYASQHKPDKLNKQGAPAIDGTDGLGNEPAYSEIYAALTLDNPKLNDQATATEVRSILKGGNGSSLLPVLTGVLFVSEVVRNHTAFHTNLMLLDLVEAGISVTEGSGFSYTWGNTLWQPEILESVMKVSELKRLKRDAKTAGDKQAIQERIEAQKSSTADTTFRGLDERNDPVLPKGGGERKLAGGLAAMSHTASAWGSGYDLEGEGAYLGVQKFTGGAPIARTPHAKPGTAFTLVRRKEATILIRWLEAALKKYTPYAKSAASSADADLNGSGIYAQLAARTAGSAEPGFRDKAFMKIGELVQQRVASFDKML